MKRLIAVAAPLLLAACAASAPAVRYYQLPNSALQLPEHTRPQTALDVVLSEPLRNPGLLYQTDAHHVNFAQRNLWAAPLADSLAASLSNKLNRQGKGAYLPKAHAAAGVPVVQVYFDRFQGTYHGSTEISGYAKLPDGSYRKLRAQTEQTGDGYEAMLNSLDSGLNRIAEQLAD